MRELGALRGLLRRIDGRGYRAYRDLRGGYGSDELELHLDHIQGDPFAAPSRLRAFVPHGVANIPPALRSSEVRRGALADFIARAFAVGCAGVQQRRGSGKSGMIEIDAPGQQVLERSACRITAAGVELRFGLGLPAAGRRVLAREAAELLLEDLPELVRASALFASLDGAALERHVEHVEDQRALRGQLRDAGLVAFIADGSVLPRNSGIDQRPMAASDAVAFASPPQLRVTLETPNGAPVSGLGIPAGVTLIVGGGYHGKSTLLAALALGIYQHRPGDGRERVVSDPSTVTIRAEDGRRVEKVDISPFVNGLPGNRDTKRFCSDDASGSTSQGANVIEAIEAGARVLLIDEDTAATNFMIRDHRMQQLIAKEQEPITPFVDKIRQLYTDCGVSSVLVVGGSGDYFDVADTVIAMQDYLPVDVTSRAKAIAMTPTGRAAEGGARFGGIGERRPMASSIDPSKGRRDAKIAARGLDSIQFGRHDIDMSAVGQLVAASQLRAIGQALHHGRDYMDGRTLAEVLDAVEEDLEELGLDAVTKRALGDFAEFRRHELAAALNRLRAMKMG